MWSIFMCTYAQVLFSYAGHRYSNRAVNNIFGATMWVIYLRVLQTGQLELLLGQDIHVTRDA